MVARGAKRSIKVATASHFLFADCRFIAGVLVVGVKQGRGGFCSGWSWYNLAPDIKFLFTYGYFTTSTELACGSDSRACYVTHPCSLRNFLKVAILHHFPSRAQLCLLRCVSSFTYGNIQRLEQLHLRSDELFSEGRYLAPLPFLSGAMLVTLRFFVHLRKHSEA